MIDVESLELSKAGKLSKPDRFSNNILFKKDELLYVVGEQFMHFFDLESNTWSEEVYPLSASLIKSK